MCAWDVRFGVSKGQVWKENLSNWERWENLSTELISRNKYQLCFVLFYLLKKSNCINITHVMEASTHRPGGPCH
jgi:hypothetical protein